MFGYERVNRNVLSRFLKTSSDCADVMCDGRSFQMLAPETGNARLPTVERRTAGTSDVEDRSRRQHVSQSTKPLFLNCSSACVQSDWEPATRLVQSQ